VGAERERHGWQLLRSAAGGALAGVAILLCLELLVTFFHMLGILPLPPWNQAVAVAVVAAVAGVVAGGARWHSGPAATVLDEAAPVVVRHIQTTSSGRTSWPWTACACSTARAARAAPRQSRFGSFASGREPSVRFAGRSAATPLAHPPVQG
jgi:hypothetical protein